MHGAPRVDLSDAEENIPDLEGGLGACGEDGADVLKNSGVLMIKKVR
jgi:hypothetical protein